MSDDYFPNKYLRSAKIILRYYRRLISNIADDVLQHEADFSSEAPNSNLEDLVEHYSRLSDQAYRLYVKLNECGTPPGTCCVRATVLKNVESDLEGAINTWLADNPDVEILAASAFKEHDVNCAVLLYRVFELDVGP